ncbi:MAG: elongation factor G [Magnetospirillum sp. WYHS-4]
MGTKAPSAPRCAVFVGPYLSGKTTLLESVLKACGATNRKGSIKEGNTVGDTSPEARSRLMSTEPNLASTEYLGDRWTFVDCPGSIELAQDAQNALMVADTAVVVVEPDATKAVALAPLFKFLDDHAVPHIIFINKVDVGSTGIRETVEALQSVSDRHLVLRELPIKDGDGIVGMVDLVSERAFRWEPGKPSEMIKLPDMLKDMEGSARAEMLEELSNFDDHLLEELLEDTVPSTDEIYGNLTKDLQQDLLVPVFFGAAEKDRGITRLLKALRHESAGHEQAARRLGVDPEGEPKATVFKTQHGSGTGKLSFVRVWGGEVKEGDNLNGNRVSGIYRMMGARQDKQPRAGAGEVVAFGRMEDIHTGTLLSPSGKAEHADWPAALTPLYSMAVHADNKADEVKISGAFQKLVEEDPSLSHEHNADTGELVLHGQGEVHLQIAIERLRNRYKLGLKGVHPQVAYKETIRKAATQHSRHKKQSGGHGEFADVHLEVKPLPRGSGFVFDEKITGGAVPRNYIPAVEHGVREFLSRGPLGFPVVDMAVTLTDGQFHAVDSSDMAFRKAAQQGMREAMPNCQPVLLEPVNKVAIAVPTDFTSKVQRLVSGRRGQILGYDARPGWKGWDEVQALMPASEMHDLIVELRSMTLGVGTFTAAFDHLQELTGKLADDIAARRNANNGAH